MKWIFEGHWLDNLIDRDGVTLRTVLSTVDNPDRVKIEVFAHAAELLHMYCVPGKQKPLFPESWKSRYGLLHHARERAAWLAASKAMQEACGEAHTKANDYYWKSTHDARDWREAKEYEEQSKVWRQRGYALGEEISGKHYEHPACLI